MLGGLVEIFGGFVREVYVPMEAIDAQVGFPPELHDLRDAVGHHLIPLLLLARADRECAPCEFEIVVAHCTAFARQRGVACDERKAAAFRDYAASFRPSLMQLDPALAQFARCEPGEFAALLNAAQELVASDGASKPEEMRFLAQLRQRLATLPAAS